MSLVKSLARVAAGVLLAKGIGAAMRGAQSQPSGRAAAGPQRTGGGFLGGLLGGGTGASAGASASGGLGGMLGQLLGGRDPAHTGSGQPYGGAHSTGTHSAGANGSPARAQGGLGRILDDFGHSNVPAASAGVAGVLGSLFGNNTAAQGLAHRDSQPENNASFGEVLNDSLTTGQEPSVTPTPEQNATAGLLLRAMIQAAKADGKIDDNEQARLMSQFGDLDDAERAFIHEQMAAPVDPAALARDVPAGLAPQVYLMSLMAINFDSEDEARYLHALADALKLAQPQVNQIHAQMGVEPLYS